MREPNQSRQLHAKDFLCTRCSAEGRKTAAVVFVGLNDPDGTDYPMCREHANQWHRDIEMALLSDIHESINTREPDAES